jgi:hypothetical protein
MKFGKTGKFPEGKIDESDEGELVLGVAFDPKSQTVIVRFDTPVAWIALPPAMAIDLGNMLIKRALEAANE